MKKIFFALFSLASFAISAQDVKIEPSERSFSDTFKIRSTRTLAFSKPQNIVEFLATTPQTTTLPTTNVPVGTLVDLVTSSTQTWTVTPIDGAAVVVSRWNNFRTTVAWTGTVWKITNRERPADYWQVSPGSGGGAPGGIVPVGASSLIMFNGSYNGTATLAAANTQKNENFVCYNDATFSYTIQPTNIVPAQAITLNFGESATFTSNGVNWVLTGTSRVNERWRSSPIANAITDTEVTIGELTFRYDSNNAASPGSLAVRSSSAGAVSCVYYATEIYGAGRATVPLTPFSASGNAAGFISLPNGGLGTNEAMEYKVIIAGSGQSFDVTLFGNGSNVTLWVEKTTK